jgi:hypothetical protein
MLRWLVLVALASVLAPVAVSQPRTETDAARLLDAWVTQQRNAVEAIERLSLVETTDRHIQSPFKSRRILLEHVLTVRDRRVSRALRLATIDGETAENERVEELEARLATALGAEWSQARRLADAPAYSVGRLRTRGSLQPDQVGGVAVWRVELSPETPDGGLRRATLWFLRDHRAPVLLQSRVELRGQETPNVIVIRTSYRALSGPAGPLAVPFHQRVEAELQQQRRWRTFTVMVHSERQASDVDVTWRGRR